ncbi:MMPL family transporter [Streptomyces sp. NPDC012508]|uniref:MMPL family transporter n=1 Tax=Streptomyces sp. NPDC012508 TaxID=3364837 RepID=UPI0036C74F73
MLFRTITAALLLVLVDAAAVVLRLAVVRLVCAITLISAFALNLTIALGSGLAVDYSVFLLSRYRDERATGAGWEAALAAARRATSRSIAYSRAGRDIHRPVITPSAATPVTDWQEWPRAGSRTTGGSRGLQGRQRAEGGSPGTGAG